jgi:hypothetical protein
MGSRSVRDDVVCCAAVLGRFGVSAAALCRGTDAERPEDAIAAELERAPSRTEFLRRVISTGPQGIDCPARYARETPWDELAALFEGLGWSFEAEDRTGRSVAATRTPTGPFSVTVADAEGRRRTAIVEYPDTPLGRYNLPGLLAHVERRLLYGFDWRFVALSDGADRWRFALVDTDDLAALRADHGDRIAPFGRPLLPRRSPVAYGPDADPAVFPDWATDGGDASPDGAASPVDDADAAGTSSAEPPVTDVPADAAATDETDDLIEFVGGTDRQETIADDAGATDAAAANLGNDDGAGDESDAEAGGPAWSDEFDDLSGWATADGDDAGRDGAGDPADATERRADAGAGADASAGTDADEGADDATDGFSLSGSPTTVRSPGGDDKDDDDDADDAGDERASAPSGPTAAETFTAAAGTADGATSEDVERGGATPPTEAAEPAETDREDETTDPLAVAAEAGESGDGDDDFFDGGLSGGPSVSRVENDSFGLPESQTDDERLRAAGAAIDAGGGVSVKGLLDDESFLPTIPAEGPTEVRVRFDATFDPSAPSPAETRTSDAEDGFVWVNADRLGSES